MYIIQNTIKIITRIAKIQPNITSLEHFLINLSLSDPYFFFFLPLPLEVITTPLSNRTRKTVFLAMHESTQLRIILAGGTIDHAFLHCFFPHMNTSKPYFSNIILQDNTIQIIFLLVTIKVSQEQKSI